MKRRCKCKTKCVSCRCGHDQGTQGKNEAFETLSIHRGLVIKFGRRALLEALLRRGRATIDDVRAAVKIPARMNPKVFGCVPDELVDQGIIERVGFEQTGRSIAHARTVSIWKLADRDAAKRWLRAHRDLPASPANAGGQALLFPIHTTNEPGATTAIDAPGMEA